VTPRFEPESGRLTVTVDEGRMQALALVGVAGEEEARVRALLGLEPDVDSRALRVTAETLPDWAEGLVLEGVHAFGRRWNVRVDDRTAHVF
jgi:hypothetical protein